MRCLECETRVDNIAKIRGKLDALKKVSTHVYLVIPEEEFNKNLNKICDNITSKGFGVIVVNSNKNIKEINQSSIFKPEKVWPQLFRKLTEKYPKSMSNIEKAFNKVYHNSYWFIFN